MNLELMLVVKLRVTLTVSPVYLLVVAAVMLSVMGSDGSMGVVAVWEEYPLREVEMMREP